MVKGGIAKANLLLLGSCRGAKRAKSGVGKFSGSAQAGGGAESSGGVSKSGGNSSCWVPHPRTGIYFPKGHEWVMDDVPEDAARLNETCWFRNVDGVDNPQYQP